MAVCKACGVVSFEIQPVKHFEGVGEAGQVPLLARLFFLLFFFPFFSLFVFIVLKGKSLASGL